MTGVILIETLRRHTRQALYWGIGCLIYALYVVAMIPDNEGLKQYIQLIGSMPSVITQSLGITDLEMMTRPEGIVALTYSAYIVLVMAVYAVLAGLNITANDEDAGIMDVMLSLPLVRWRVIVEKFAAYSLLMVIIALGGFLGLVIGAQFNANAQAIDTLKMLESSLNLLPVGLVIMAGTATLAVIVRRKATAATWAGVWVAVSFVIDMVGKSATDGLLGTLRSLSVFKYYDSNEILITGLVWGNVIALLLLSVGLVGFACYRFQKRDIGV